MNIRNTLIAALVFLFLGCPSCNHTEKRKTLIAITTPSGTPDTETNGLVQILHEMENVECRLVSFGEIREGILARDKFSLVWYHRQDTSMVQQDEEDLADNIRHFLEGGGNVVLSLDAVRMLNAWDIEKNDIEVKNIEVTDRGFGRNLGFHAYIRHPLFNKMNGGAYIWHSDKDHTERRLGFFENNVPGAPEAKIIGIDWGYITYHESSKLLWQTGVGKGMILAIGAYTHYSEFNYNALHLKQFTHNVIDYLTSQKCDKSALFWDYSPLTVEEADGAGTKFIAGGASEWAEEHDPLDLLSEKEYSRFDLAGKRMSFFGNEKSGVDEIWLHPFMAFRDIRIGAVAEGTDEVIWLENQDPVIINNPGHLKRKYMLNGKILDEIMVVDKENPVGAIHYEWEGRSIKKLFVAVKSNMRLMWPYSQESTGKLSWAWDMNSNTLSVSDRNDINRTFLRFSNAPAGKTIGRYEISVGADGEPVATETDKFQVAAIFSFDVEDCKAFDISFTGFGMDETILTPEVRKLVENPYLVYQRSREYYKNLLANSLVIESDDIEFNKAFLWALIGADQFKVNTPGIGESLLAGYASTAYGWNGRQAVSGRPGYAWYFGRDAEWSGFAFNRTGDYVTVKNILGTLNRFMDLNGKVYHELTTSGSVHYDAADATPLYVILTGEYLKYSGDTEYIKKNIGYFRRAMKYCLSTDTDADGLIENTSVGHGWIEGGSLHGAHTTFYLAGIWGSALDHAAYVESLMGDETAAEMYRKKAGAVRKIIDEKFWNDSLQFYNYGLRRDGSMETERTVLPAVPVLLGQTNSRKAKETVKLFASESFSSDWGVRILMKESKLYNPSGYHYGSVWPLFTGWTSLAEFRTGRYVQGLSHAMNNLMIYDDWDKGAVEEVLNGEIYLPSGVCRHQCWSHTMAVQPLIEGLLQPDPDAINNSMAVSPHFPASWNNAAIRNIPAGNTRFDCIFERTPDGYSLDFVHTAGQEINLAVSPFIPQGAINTEIKTGDIVYKINDPVQICLSRVNSTLRLNVKYDNGIELFPVYLNPEPGDRSSGMRIIDCYYDSGRYYIEYQKPAIQTDQLYLRYPGIVKDVTGAEIVARKADILTLEIRASGNTGKYTNGRIILELS